MGFWIEYDPSTPFIHAWFRHPRKFNSHRVNPLLSAQRTKSMVAHANQCLLGSTWQGGIYNVLPWGSALLTREDTRVETANEGRFSSQNVMQWKWSRWTPLNLLTHYILMIILSLPPDELLKNFISALQSNNFLKKEKKEKIQSDKVGTGKYPFFFFFFSGSAWSCKTGKRMMKKSSFFFS